MKKRLFVLAALSLCFSLFFPRPSQGGCRRSFVILVEFLLNEATLDEAIDLLSKSRRRRWNEDGCLVYDVLLSEENPAQVFLYESYESGEPIRYIPMLLLQGDCPEKTETADQKPKDHQGLSAELEGENAP
jgi:hypothetical protein